MRFRTVTVGECYPFDVPRSLDFFGRHGDDLIDRWDGTVFTRTAPYRDTVVPLAVTASPAGAGRTITVTGPHHMTASILADLARNQFLYDGEVLRRLACRDPAFAALLPEYSDLAILAQRNLLHALVRCISAQQVNLAWAAVTRARLTQLVGRELVIGDRHVYTLDAEQLADTPVEALRALQFSTRKAQYLIAAAAAIASGTISVGTLAASTDEDALNQLTTLHGIGTWSAEWILIRTLGRSRVAAGDLVVRKAVGWLYNIAVPTEAEVRSATAHWGPAAAMAQTALLEAYQHRRLSRPRDNAAN